MEGWAATAMTRRIPLPRLYREAPVESIGRLRNHRLPRRRARDPARARRRRRAAGADRAARAAPTDIVTVAPQCSSRRCATPAPMARRPQDRASGGRYRIGRAVDPARAAGCRRRVLQLAPCGRRIRRCSVRDAAGYVTRRATARARARMTAGSRFRATRCCRARCRRSSRWRARRASGATTRAAATRARRAAPSS